MPNWKAAFTPSTVARINAIISDVTRDEVASSAGAKTHRVRRHSHITNQHEAFGIEDYTTLVQAALKAGCTLRFQQDGSASLAVNSRRSAGSFGFNAGAFIDGAKQLQWNDK